MARRILLSLLHEIYQSVILLCGVAPSCFNSLISAYEEHVAGINSTILDLHQNEARADQVLPLSHPSLQIIRALEHLLLSNVHSYKLRDSGAPGQGSPHDPQKIKRTPPELD